MNSRLQRCSHLLRFTLPPVRGQKRGVGAGGRVCLASRSSCHPLAVLGFVIGVVRSPVRSCPCFSLCRALHGLLPGAAARCLVTARGSLRVLGRALRLEPRWVSSPSFWMSLRSLPRVAWRVGLPRFQLRPFSGSDLFPGKRADGARCPGPSENVVRSQVAGDWQVLKAVVICDRLRHPSMAPNSCVLLPGPPCRGSVFGEGGSGLPGWVRKGKFP